MAVRKKTQEIVTGYTGPFSSFTEWHAFGIGFYYGAREEYDQLPEGLWDEDADLYNADVVAEDHYTYVGFEAGEWWQRNRRKGYGVVGLLGAAALAAARYLLDMKAAGWW